jgi:two-component system, NarL family, nitrate/nitrite response regulator NarL
MTAASQIRILLVDDHAVVRAGLRMLLESQPGLTVSGEAATRAEALEHAAATSPDIILLDLDLGTDSGLDLLPALRTAAPDARVILLTGLRDTEQHRRAVRLGAMGLVRKEQAFGVLLTAIAKVAAGEAWLDPAMVASVLTELAHAVGQPDPEAIKLARLTNREREVIALICEGLPNKQIGQRMAISEATVRHHLTSIFDKLGVTSRLELVIYAYRWELNSPPSREPLKR